MVVCGVTLSPSGPEERVGAGRGAGDAAAGPVSEERQDGPTVVLVSVGRAAAHIAAVLCFQNTRQC